MKKIPILIDCDTGIDDLISFVLTLSSDKLDILGVMTVAGNVNLKLTTYNTYNGLRFMGRGEIPMAAGAAKPIVRTYHDASEIHGNSGTGEFHFPDPKEPVTDPCGAVEFMYRILMQAEEKVTILALAPLTNIAELFAAHPDCKEHVERVVFMGGSIASGNPTPVATFNVWVDPEAAKMVLREGVPFYMCPLDTTREAYLTEADRERIREVGNPVSDMVYLMLDSYRSRENAETNGAARFKGVCVHDLCTAAFVTNPELFETVKYYADVETRGELTTGFTMIDHENNLNLSDGEKNIHYIKSVDRDGFLRVFFEALRHFS